MGVTLQQRNIDLGWTHEEERRPFSPAPSPHNDDEHRPVTGHPIPRRSPCNSFTMGHQYKRIPKKNCCPSAHVSKGLNEAKKRKSSVKANMKEPIKPSEQGKVEERSKKKLQGQSGMVPHKSKHLRVEAGPANLKSPGLNTGDGPNKSNQPDLGSSHAKTHPTSESVIHSESINPALNINAVPMADMALKLQNHKVSQNLINHSTNSKTLSQAPKSRNDSSIPGSGKGSSRFCRYFLKPTGCKHKENCKFVHNETLRKTSIGNGQSQKTDSRQGSRFTGLPGTTIKPCGLKRQPAESFPKLDEDEPTVSKTKDTKTLSSTKQIPPADSRKSNINRASVQAMAPKVKDNKANRPYSQIAVNKSEIRKTAKNYNQITAPKSKENETTETYTKMVAIKSQDDKPVITYNHTAAIKSKDVKTTKSYCQIAAPTVKGNREVKSKSQVMAANHKEALQETSSETVSVEQKWKNAELAEWVVRNIQSNQIKKHLLPHLHAGHSPVSFLNKRPEELKKKSVFHHFSQLPGEIRNQIWDLILDAESYDQRLTYRHEFIKEGQLYPARLLPQSITPRLLHVNMESRSRAKSRYDWVFASEQYGSMAWFNFQKDTLLLHTANSCELALMLRLLMKSDMSRVLRLKIPLRDYLINQQGIWFLIARFKNLQKLKFMVGDSIEDKPWKSNTELMANAQAAIRIPWKRSHPNRRAPIVGLAVVDAFQAHVMGIDGLKWC